MKPLNRSSIAEATHARIHTRGVDLYKRDEEGTWLYLDNQGTWARAYGTSEKDCIKLTDYEGLENTAEAKSAKETYWNGEGLPPVGTICEFRERGIEKWKPCEVLYSSRWTVVIREPDLGDIDVAYNDVDSDIEFRLIRTPEQLKAEEREEAVKAMAEDIGYLPLNTRAIPTLYALFDAGYRKVQS